MYKHFFPSFYFHHFFQFRHTKVPWNEWKQQFPWIIFGWNEILDSICCWARDGEKCGDFFHSIRLLAIFSTNSRESEREYFDILIGGFSLFSRWFFVYDKYLWAHCLWYTLLTWENGQTSYANSVRGVGVSKRDRELVMDFVLSGFLSLSQPQSCGCGYFGQMKRNKKPKDGVQWLAT